MTEPTTFVQLVLSVPGREGTKTHTWIPVNSRMDAATAADILNTLSMAMLEAIETVGGIQLELQVDAPG